METGEARKQPASRVKRIALPAGPILAVAFAAALRAGGLELDDSIIHEARISDDPRLEKARQLIERLDHR